MISGYLARKRPEPKRDDEDERRKRKSPERKKALDGQFDVADAVAVVEKLW